MRLRLVARILLHIPKPHVFVLGRQQAVVDVSSATFLRSACAVASNATDCPAVGNQVQESMTTPETKPRFVLARWARAVIGILLGIGLVVSIWWIVFGWPLPVRLWILLAVVAGSSLTGLVALFIKEVPGRLRQGLVAGSTLIAVLAALMAVPALQGAGPGGQPTPQPSSTGSELSTPLASQPSGASEPLTASLKFNNSLTPCENFTIPKSFLPSIPKSENGNLTAGGLDAKWIYENGGATLSEAELTIQGNTEDAVIIHRLRVVDLERKPAVKDAIGVLPCGGSGGDMYPRSFEVVMGDQPQIRHRRVENAPVPEGVPTPEPLDTDLPIKVSNSDPEIFMLKVTGPECFCEWRLAIDWTSRGQSGTTVVDHGFGKIRSDTFDYKQRDVYWLQDGEWHT
jgi:hypothetical protein